MLNANEANLEKAKRWFARIKLGQQTQPRVSFDYGLSLNPDAIFFLTDGEFDDGTYEFLMEVAARSDRITENPHDSVWKSAGGTGAGGNCTSIQR